MIYISLFIAIGVAVVLMVRLFYKQGLEKKKQLNLAKTYGRLVMKYKLSIEETYVHGGRLIGLDRRNKKLLLIDHSGPIKKEACLSVGQIDSCRVIGEKDEVTKCTVKLILEINHKWNKGQSEFVFFDESKDKIVEKPSLMKRAEYWKRKIDLCRNPGKVGPGFEFVL